MRLFILPLLLFLAAGCATQTQSAHRATHSTAPSATQSEQQQTAENRDFANEDFSPSFDDDLPSVIITDQLESPANLNPPYKLDKGGADPVADRKIIYNATMDLRVANRRAALHEIEALIKNYEGFMENSSLESITFRISPDDFEEALQELETIGEVTQRQVNSRDVTDQYTDLELRLEVAEKSRERLLALLEKAEKVEDILKVEEDVRRLTEEIESLKGQLRNLDDRIQWSTITVRLQERIQDTTTTWRSGEAPFSWMAILGVGGMLVEPKEDWPLNGGGFWGTEFALATEGNSPVPESFVTLYYDKDDVLATTSEGYRLSVDYIKARQETSLDFWMNALRTDFRERLGYGIDEVSDFAMDNDDLEAKKLRATVSYGGETWTFELWLIQDTESPDDLLVVQYSRLKRDAELYSEEVETAVRGAQITPRLLF